MGDNLKMDIKKEKRRWEVVNRIYLAQDRDKWWALVEIPINFRFPRMVGEF
jgi:hypothetical protein